MIFPETFSEGVVSVLLVLQGMAIFLSFLRVVLGPSLPDRVIALDTVAVLAVGWIALYSIVAGDPVYLRAAIVLALVAFLGTVAFARYVEKKGGES